MKLSTGLVSNVTRRAEGFVRRGWMCRIEPIEDDSRLDLAALYGEPPSNIKFVETVDLIADPSSDTASWMMSRMRELIPHYADDADFQVWRQAWSWWSHDDKHIAEMAVEFALSIRRHRHDDKFRLPTATGKYERKAFHGYAGTLRWGGLWADFGSPAGKVFAHGWGQAHPNYWAINWEEIVQRWPQ